MRRFWTYLVMLPLSWMLLLFSVPWLQHHVQLPHLHLIQTPKRLPTGYHRLSDTIIQQTGPERLIMYTFTHAALPPLGFTIRSGYSKPTPCPPAWESFLPKNAAAGCHDTVTYRWFHDEIEYTLYQQPASLTQPEMQQVAESLGLELLLINP